MEIVELKASVRSQTGKKGAKECRKQGLLPGVFYGRGDQPTPVAVNPKELDRVLHTHAGGNAIIRLTLEGRDSEPVTVVVKELQVESIKGTMRHVDFCKISLDQEIRTTVPFKVMGESPGVKSGGILEHTLWELEIECLPLNIPDYIEVDVSGLNIGDSVAVSDLKVPEGITVLTDESVSVFSIAAPRVEEVVEVAPEAEVEGPEPEVIGTKPEREAKGAEEKEETTEEKKRSDEKRKSKE
jgi:large subunit ribosomal protein L25